MREVVQTTSQKPIENSGVIRTPQFLTQRIMLVHSMISTGITMVGLKQKMEPHLELVMVHRSAFLLDL